jgi:hypothetical protein
MSTLLRTTLIVTMSAVVACGGSSSKSGPLSADEAEPLDKAAVGAVLNDTAATAEPLSVGVPVFGALADATDVDFYSFSARASQVLTADVYAVRLAPASWTEAPAITLYGSDGITVLWRNDPVILNWPPGPDIGLGGVAIPADGTYYLAISATAGDDDVGAYALRLALRTPDGSLQHEAEAADATGVNNTIETGQPIVPGLIEGTTLNGEDDYYTFSLTATRRVVFTMTAYRNGSAGGAGGTSAFYDPLLYLVEADGTPITDNDDTHYVDSALDATLAPGDYAVRVSKYGRNNPGTVPYLLEFDRLAVSPTAETGTNTTRDAAMAVSYGHTYSGTFGAAGEHHFYTFTGKAGDLIRMDALDKAHISAAPVITDGDGNAIPLDSNDDPSTYVATILQADGAYTIDLTGSGAGTFSVELDRLAAAAYEVEPNDAAGAESSFSGSGWAAGALGAADDVDRFTFSAEDKQLVTIALLGDGHQDEEWYLGSTLDYPVLTVYDAEGNELVQTQIADNLPVGMVRPESNLEASFRAPAKGTYTVAVSLASGHPLGNHPYYALRLYKNQ